MISKSPAKTMVILINAPMNSYLAPFVKKAFLPNMVLVTSRLDRMVELTKKYVIGYCLDFIIKQTPFLVVISHSKRLTLV